MNTVYDGLYPSNTAYDLLNGIHNQIMQLMGRKNNGILPYLLVGKI